MLALVDMDALRRAAAGAALRRPAAARRARPRADHRAADPAARRAALGARPVPAHQGARRAQAPAEGARHLLRPRHPQPGRGDGARRPHRGDERTAASSRPARRARCSTLPRTAFVAQFMGGHNVIATTAGKIAVRADRLKLRPGERAAARLAGDGARRRIPGHPRAGHARGRRRHRAHRDARARPSSTPSPLRPGERGRDRLERQRHPSTVRSGVTDAARRSQEQESDMAKTSNPSGRGVIAAHRAQGAAAIAGAPPARARSPAFRPCMRRSRRCCAISAPR